MSLKLLKAEDYAQIAYSGVFRKNGEPFINHAQRVKKYLEEIGITDENVLISALLHGLPQVSDVTYEEIEKEFNPEIRFIIESLEQISKIVIPFSDKSENIDLLHKLIIHLAKDIRVLIIRLADRVENVKTTESLTRPEQEWIAKLSLNVYAPIAKASGLYFFTRELEDESFKIIDNERYNLIKNFQDNKFSQIEKELEQIKLQISNFLKKENQENFDITFRKKGIYSTHLKAKNKAKNLKIKDANDFDGLFDLLGVRVLVSDIETCYKVLAFVQETWTNIQSEFDDYIAHPKSNGYKSIQTAIYVNDTSKCEIQIRTFEMHNENEYGGSSHFAYKYGTGKKNNSSAWIKDLISMKENLQTNLTDNSSKIDLFKNMVFAFTPKNDLIVLPGGSTIVDFAYAIHSNIGDTCSGGILNGKMVQLNTEIKSGDKIEILTTKSKKPTADWLVFVK
jgi:GTP diphosphokinase / guanosine-3',5'-bis(diphosphate) 3'-diphosphatase